MKARRMDTVCDLFDKVGPDRVWPEEAGKYAQESQGSVRGVRGGCPLPVLFDEMDEHIAVKICGELKVHGVHRRQRLQPVDERLLERRTFADSQQGRGEVFSLIAQPVLPRLRRHSHRVGIELRKRHRTQCGLDIGYAIARLATKLTRLPAAHWYLRQDWNLVGESKGLDRSVVCRHLYLQFVGITLSTSSG